MEAKKILNDGFVRLVSSCADDLSVVNSARVSFGKTKETMEDADKGLINFLMREHHGTPFEHNFFSFHVKAPIFVTREWFRHRIGWSYNEYSGRYSVINDSWYIPDVGSVRTQVGKPGSYTFESMDEETAQDIIQVMDESNARSFREYTYLLERGVAKELAREILPVGAYTEFYASTNARALMNFINLRADENAQYEIRQYANALAEYLEQEMPVTYSAFISNGGVAP